MYLFKIINLLSVIRFYVDACQADFIYSLVNGNELILMRLPTLWLKHYYYRRADKVRAHWKSLVKYAKLAEVSQFIRSKVSVEVMEIIMHHCARVTLKLEGQNLHTKHSAEIRFSPKLPLAIGRAMYAGAPEALGEFPLLLQGLLTVCVCRHRGPLGRTGETCTRKRCGHLQ